jgi:hypothetical protein
VLHVASRPIEEERSIGGPAVRSANILARRGFITMQRQPGGWHSAQLTEAGAEALNLYDASK